MKTVLSYIVQKRLSMENENVATEALRCWTMGATLDVTTIINS